MRRRPSPLSKAARASVAIEYGRAQTELRRLGLKGPCEASGSGQHDHFDRYPTDKRQVHRDCRQRRQRLPTERDRSGQRALRRAESSARGELAANADSRNTPTAATAAWRGGQPALGVV